MATGVINYENIRSSFEWQILILGWMYDHYGDYNAAFLVAGIPPIIGAVLMLAIYRVYGHRTQAVALENVESAASLQCDPAVTSKTVAASMMTASATKTTFVADDESVSAVEKESLLKMSEN